MPAGRVSFVRTDPTDVGVRQIIARIDDGPNTTLLFGETADVEVAPGDHRLRVHNTLFWKTIPFTIGAGEHLEFTVVNTSGFFSFGVLAVIGAAPLYLQVRSRKVGAQPE